MVVNKWIGDLRAKLIRGRRIVRRAVTERADSWKEQFESAARWINKYHVDEAHQRKLLLDALKRIEELEEEVGRLRTALSNGKVVPMKRPR